MFRGNERIKEEGHSTDLFRREALRFIDNNRERPFFLYLPWNAPHIASTYDKKARQVLQEYLRMYDLGESHDLSNSQATARRDMEIRWATWKKEMDAAEPRGPFRDY